MSREEPIFGIDVHSEFQRDLNFERARAEDYEFCLVKASEGPYRDGKGYVPSGFKEFFRRAESEGFVMGVYAFLVNTPAEAQADHFLRTIEAVGGPEDKILIVDFEAYQNPALTPGNKQLMKFVSEVSRRVGRHPIVVYSGRDFWNGGDSSGKFSQYGADAAWDAYYLHMDPVKPRQFYARSKQDFQRAKLPWGWGKPWGDVEPWFWQFTSAGSVAGMNIDVNAYRGTPEQLLALTGAKERERAGHGDDGRNGGGREVLSHGVVDGTNFAKGYKYVTRLVDHMKYWVWTDGPVPDGEGAYAVDRPLPSVDDLKGKRIFCLTGDTQVVAENIKRSFKRRYSGEVITVKTADGCKLTGTPNHPVLTDQGWLPLHALKVGGNVIRSREFGKRTGREPDNNHRPTSLEQVHRSLALFGEVERVVGTPLDFHGDGMNGEVEIVVPERILLDGGQSPVSEHGLKLGFPYAAVARTGKPVAGFVRSTDHGKPFRFGEQAVLESLCFGDAPDGYARLSERAGDDVVVGAEAFRYGAGRFASKVIPDNSNSVKIKTVSWGASRSVGTPTKPGTLLDSTQLDSSTLESPVNTSSRAAESFSNLVDAFASKIGIDDAVLGDVVSSERFRLDAIETSLHSLSSELDTSFDEPVLDGIRGSAQSPGYSANGFPSEVCIDKIIGVNVSVFEGHVYNLETYSGTYVANGIISHNCAGVPNLFRRAVGKSIPTRGDTRYDGGIAAYFYTSAFGGLGPGFFSKVDVPFDLARAKKWARETRSGVLIGRSYRNDTLAGQGHVAILLPDGKVLQSFQMGDDGAPGLNANFTIEQSHAGGYYEHMVHPNDWINHDKGQVT